jgi:hypothetical protein
MRSALIIKAKRALTRSTFNFGTPVNSPLLIRRPTMSMSSSNRS